MPVDLNSLPGVNPAPNGLVDLNSMPGLDNSEFRSRDNPLTHGVGRVTGPVLDFLHHASFGLTDKEIAAMQGIGLMGGGVKEGDFSDRYRGSLVNFRNNLKEFEGDSPTTAKAAEAAGLVAPILVSGPAAAAESTFGKGLLTSAKHGAGWGAVTGFGGTNDESLGEDAKATGIGAATGAVAGPALATGLGIARVPFRMAGRAGSVFGEEGQELAAGRVLNETKTGSNPFEHAPLPGMKLTSGQASNDRGLLWLENNVSQATPEGATKFAESLAANNKAIRTGIEQLGDHGADAPSAMSAALDRIYTAHKKLVGEIWKKADVSNSGGVSGYQFNNFMKKYVGGLPIADQAQVPADVMGVVEKLGTAKTQNLSDVQSVRSMLSSRATQAARAGDGNLARILGGLADQTESFIDMKAAQLGDKLPLYKEARAATRAMKETFDQPPAVRKALGVDSHGADRVPESAMADHFIRSGKGAQEDFNAYLKAISIKDPKTGITSYDPDALKAAQDAFAQKFIKQVTNAGVDAQGETLVSPAKMQKFLTDYRHIINSPAFEPAQRDLISRIAKATQMASRSAAAKPPGGGSDTFQKLSGDRFIDALVGPHASKLLGVASKVGGAVWGALEEGKMGAMMGFMGGEKVGGLLNDLYKAPRDKVVSIITEAMHDPQLAKDLMTKASNSNAKLLPPPRRAKIFGVLGAQASQPVVNALTAPQ